MTGRPEDRAGQGMVPSGSAEAWSEP